MGESHNIPWKVLSTPLGDVPFYVIEFNEHGGCTSPQALEQLLKEQNRTDFFLFSHGWNNDWRAATDRYDRFISRFIEVRQANWNPPGRDFRPVCVGVFWPSAALVAPWEHAPVIAGGDGPADPDVAALAGALDPGARARLLAISADPGASEDDAAELAEILAPLLAGGDDEIGAGGGAASPGDLLKVWKAARVPGAVPAGAPGGFIDDDAPAVGAAPDAAGWNPLSPIRDGIRLTTVLLMKDRAGRVGGTGVAQMLRDIIDGCPDARVSLAGHSYGAKVVLSALCNGPAPSRRVDSVLLLEPALSCYAFTADLQGHPGGYRSALDRVREPLITTYSSNDVPLRWFFHLAVRRSSDLAEAVIAGQPPSKFAALGGYGPQGVDAEWIDMPGTGQAYPAAGGNRIVAVNGTRFISGHGAVETPETAWALLSQVRG
jgi:hypothetical protein